MLLDHPVISQRYFFPRRQALADAWVVDVGDAELHCYRRDTGAERCFVHFHGNGEIVADYLPDYADAIAAMGLDVLLVEYRGYGGSTGTPMLGRMLEDAVTVIEALDRPTSELIVYGRSVGSIYAIEAAHRFGDIAGLVIESGIADPLQRLAMRLEAWELDASDDALEAEADAHLDHGLKLGGYAGRLLVMHAEDDALVTVDNALDNHEWGGSPHKELVIFERGGHNAIMATNWEAYIAKLQEFCTG